MSNTEKKLALCPFCGNNVGNNIIYNKDTKKNGGSNAMIVTVKIIILIQKKKQLNY